jgi:UDPglucose 6-dehydrogenase
LALDLESEGYNFAGSPEFLREGSAVQDFFSPDRIIVGSNHVNVANQVLSLFGELNCPKTAMSLTAAETTKYAANSYLAVRLSFINEVARLCEAVGADITEVSKGLSQDKRIGGHFLAAGPGWGGSCFPKDVRAIVHSASLHNLELPTVAAAALSNEISQSRVVDLALAALGGSVKGKKIAVWGLTYKANTDDVRDSPALSIVRRLCSLGALVKAFDPRAVNVEMQGFVRAESALLACTDAELLIVATEWAEFHEIDPKSACASMETSKVLDARNILDLHKWIDEADYFWSTGRKSISRQ